VENKKIYFFLPALERFFFCSLVITAILNLENKPKHVKVELLFLDAFAKLCKARISFVIFFHVSVCPSVHMEQFRLPLDGFQ
jgi:hypothetical protein